MIEVYVDGASRGDSGMAGAGIFIKNGSEVEQHSVPLGILSNHEAEYAALLKGLDICLQKGYTVVSFRTDSQLVERAVENRYVKNPVYVPLLEKALEQIDKFDLFFLKWVPAKENRADQLAKQAIHLNE
ncbi:reverse transcriptase-like protein [Bacillus marinisedimentorum]|uniref:reverse transcriptase-like protein n=1 Tax=Bacillus marinisedimentorum TaxID=1821260 RepID=UPI0007DF39B5|nr:reverse transcriptase-like protein [Bacillus marinisedimentorum]